MQRTTLAAAGVCLPVLAVLAVAMPPAAEEDEELKRLRSLGYI